MTSLRIVFAGSPAAAVPSLRGLAASKHEVVAVITRQDSAVGRRGRLTPTAIATAAHELGIRTLKANRLSEDVTAEVEAIEPDLGVIVAYGALVREPLLSTPRLGWINLHFSLLPRWRGAAPVQRAIIAGDQITGVSVFQLVPELDAGDVFATATTTIGRHESAGHLLETLSNSGAETLLSVVDGLSTGTAIASKQIGEATLAPKLGLEDGRIDWNADAATVVNRIRGVTPEPGAFTIVDGARLKVLDAAIDHGAPALGPATIVLNGKSVLVGTSSVPVELLTVLPAGRKAMSAADWWRGRASDSAVAK